MNLQDVSHIHIPDGDVRMIHDSDNRLLWGAVGYNVLFSGNTFQQSYTGKNLFPSSVTWTVNRAFPTSSQGEWANWAGYYGFLDYIEVEPDTTYTFSNAENLKFIYGLQYYDSDKNWISGTNEANTFTTPSNCHYIRGAVLSNTAPTQCQLELGSTATSYEPYVGGQPSPSPDFPQQIQTVTGEQTVAVQGKNLLNYNTIVQTTLNGVTLSLADDGTITLNGTCSSDNTRFAFDGLSLALDGTYTLSSEVISGTITNATNMTKIRLFKSGYSGAIRVDLANTSTSSTSSASGNYILNDIRIDNGVVFTNYKIKIQLEKSATATSFEPYSKHIYPINLGSLELCKLGAYQDYIWKDGESWKVHKATKKAILDGSESWLGSGSANVQYTTKITDYATSGNVPFSASFAGITNVSGAYLVTGDNTIAFINRNDIYRFYIKSAGVASSQTAVKNWLSNHNTTVYYALATPTDTTITDTNLIAQLEAIYNLVRRYGYNFVVSASGNNLPIIIDRTLL